MNYKKVFVTGADGFIGSTLVERLVARGSEVTAFTMYNSFGTRGWLDSVSTDVMRSVQVVAGDLRDFDSVRSAAKGCEACLHLGALIAIPYSYAAPEAYLDTNVRGTLNVLRAARDLGLRRVVHVSTSEVYGSALRVPIDEEHLLRGQSPYSASKIAADQLAYSFYCSFNLPVVTIRPFNTYGPRQSARAVIPTIITQLASAKEVRLGSVDTTRDFTFVEDTADGMIAGLNADDAVLGETVNLGVGFDVSIGRVAELLSEIMGKRLSIVTDDKRLRPAKSEVERLVSDNSKAKRLLGWSPRLAGQPGLKKGLEQTVAWYLNPTNLALYRPTDYTI